VSHLRQRSRSQNSSLHLQAFSLGLPRHLRRANRNRLPRQLLLLRHSLLGRMSPRVTGLVLAQLRLLPLQQQLLRPPQHRLPRLQASPSVPTMRRPDFSSMPKLKKQRQLQHLLLQHQRLTLLRTNRRRLVRRTKPVSALGQVNRALVRVQIHRQQPLPCPRHQHSTSPR
jgi:hypothetical protein